MPLATGGPTRLEIIRDRTRLQAARDIMGKRLFSTVAVTTSSIGTVARLSNSARRRAASTRPSLEEGGVARLWALQVDPPRDHQACSYAEPLRRMVVLLGDFNLHSEGIAVDYVVPGVRRPTRRRVPLGRDGQQHAGASQRSWTAAPSISTQPTLSQRSGLCGAAGGRTARDGEAGGEDRCQPSLNLVVCLVVARAARPPDAHAQTHRHADILPEVDTAAGSGKGSQSQSAARGSDTEPTRGPGALAHA